jgi:hypothetical protein
MLLLGMPTAPGSGLRLKVFDAIEQLCSRALATSKGATPCPDLDEPRRPAVSSDSPNASNGWRRNSARRAVIAAQIEWTTISTELHSITPGGSRSASVEAKKSQARRRNHHQHPLTPCRSAQVRCYFG